MGKMDPRRESKRKGRRKKKKQRINYDFNATAAELNIKQTAGQPIILLSTTISR